MPLVPITHALAKGEALLSPMRFSTRDALLDICHTGLGHLAREAENFRGSLSFSLRLMDHFTKELARLTYLLEHRPEKNSFIDIHLFGDVQACAFALVEDMALFMREKKLHAGCAPQPGPEERIMAFFETCGNWPRDGAEMVVDYYYTQIPLAVMHEKQGPATAP